MHRSLRVAGLVGAILAGATLAACGTSAAEPDASPTSAASPSPTTTTEPAPAGAVTLEVGEIMSESFGDPVAPPDELVAAVVDAAQSYVDEATVNPLLSGGVSSDLQRLFGAPVDTRVAPSGADRAALTDEAVPPAVSDIETESVPLAIAALADGLGNWVSVGVTLDYRVNAQLADGPVEIHRFGDLYFTPVEGDWKITAYDVGVTRTTDVGVDADDAASDGSDA